MRVKGGPTGCDKKLIQPKRGITTANGKEERRGMDETHLSGLNWDPASNKIRKESVAPLQT